MTSTSIWQRTMPRSPSATAPKTAPTLQALPRELIKLICTHLYNPLHLTQQDRLTWSIFSTVDMDPDRQTALESLIAFGSTCRKVRKEVRVILFRCVRIPGIPEAEELIANRDGWAKLVKSIIIDLSMFDPDPSPTPIGGSSQLALLHAPRSCWVESALLIKLFNSLPALHHVSFFADASDDSTLSLVFAALIPHPSTHPVPPATPSPSAYTSSLPSTTSPVASTRALTEPPAIPFGSRIRSFGWRQRAVPPPALRSFSQTSTFVATLHILRHAHRLGFVIIDADMAGMERADILVTINELARRERPQGESGKLMNKDRVSIMICGPIAGWEDGARPIAGEQLNSVAVPVGTQLENERPTPRLFLQDIVDTFQDIKELFIDRPLRKISGSPSETLPLFRILLTPLKALTHLRLLQIGSYPLSHALQFEATRLVANLCPNLIIAGWLGEAGETGWWGIWRDRVAGTYELKLMELGDLYRLEEEADQWERSTITRERGKRSRAEQNGDLGLNLTGEDKRRRLMSVGALVA